MLDLEQRATSMLPQSPNVIALLNKKNIDNKTKKSLIYKAKLLI